MAGGYLIRDSFDTGSNPLLPGPIGTYELPLVVQDRQFNPDGSLLYPVAPAATNGPWIGEYFGDVMLVNGKIWPALTLEPAVYRFRVLNGCNARILNLRISTANDSATVPMTIIGTEGGLLPVNPTGSNGLVMTPAERYDVICDFRRFAGQTLLMKNSKPPSSVVSTPAPSLPKVMQITVKPTASSGAPMTVPGPGSLPANPAVTALTGLGPPKLSGGTVAARMITLNEVTPNTPTWRLNLNAHPYGDPQPGNRDADVEHRRGLVLREHHPRHPPDAHPPVHVQGNGPLQLRYRRLRRGQRRTQRRPAAGRLNPDAVPEGRADSPAPDEAGFKETVKANPGQVTVVRAKFTPPSTVLDSTGHPTEQKYVHHCHIVEHEDNDMMERVLVKP
jgi:spore coat protein A